MLNDASVRDRLLSTIDSLDGELRKKKPRWKKTLATFFILFSCLADLKTVDPNIYEQLYKTATSIAQVLHEEGTLEHHRKRQNLPQDHQQPALGRGRRNEPLDDELSDIEDTEN